MNTFRKKTCFKALLLPQRWLCILSRYIVLAMAAGAIVLFLAGAYLSAGVLAAFWLFMLLFDMVTPDQIYLMQLNDKKLLIEIFKNDFKRRKRKDMRRKISFIRIIEEPAGGTAEVLWPGQVIFGFDDKLYRQGILLIKPQPAEWLVIRDGYETGHLLGRKISDYAFTERAAPGCNPLTFIHGTEFHTLETVTFDAYPQFVFDQYAATYRELFPSGIPELDAKNAAFLNGSFILCQDSDGLKLLKCAEARNGLPAVYLAVSGKAGLLKDGKAKLYDIGADGCLRLSTLKS